MPVANTYGHHTLNEYRISGDGVYDSGSNSKVIAAVVVIALFLGVGGYFYYSTPKYVPAPAATSDAIQEAPAAPDTSAPAAADNTAPSDVAAPSAMPEAPAAALPENKASTTPAQPAQRVKPQSAKPAMKSPVPAPSEGSASPDIPAPAPAAPAQPMTNDPAGGTASDSGVSAPEASAETAPKAADSVGG